MIMEQLIRDEIRRFVLDSPDKPLPGSDQTYFDEPLVGFAAADDLLFSQYKTVNRRVPYDPRRDHGKYLYGVECRKGFPTVSAGFSPLPGGDPSKQPQGRTYAIAGLGVDPRPWRKVQYAAAVASGGTVSRYLGVSEPLPRSLSGMWRPVKESPAGMALDLVGAAPRPTPQVSAHSGLSRWADHRERNRHRCGSVITEEVIHSYSTKLCRPMEQLPLFP